jgi:hypothetical protein
VGGGRGVCAEDLQPWRDGEESREELVRNGQTSLIIVIFSKLVTTKY